MIKIGETPLDDISGLKIRNISTRAEMLEWGSDNINAENETRKEYILALQVVDSGDYKKLKQFMFPD